MISHWLLGEWGSAPKVLITTGKDNIVCTSERNFVTDHSNPRGRGLEAAAVIGCLYLLFMRRQAKCSNSTLMSYQPCGIILGHANLYINNSITLTWNYQLVGIGTPIKGHVFTVTAGQLASMHCCNVIPQEALDQLKQADKDDFGDQTVIWPGWRRNPEVV